jgi:hypothetical protein
MTDVLAVLIPGAGVAGFLAGWYANEHCTRALARRCTPDDS